MALTIETGAGVRGANAYFNAAFVDSFLAARGRSDENGWSGLGATEKDAIVVKGTDYFEKRWTGRVRGVRRFFFEDENATATVTFSGVPSADETITVGAEVYTWKASLTGAANEILLGGTATACATNFANAVVNDQDSEGVTHGTGTVANAQATANADGTAVTLTAIAPGSSGDFTTISEASSNVTTTDFSGGLDGGQQPLIFPRESLYTRSGAKVEGVPIEAKNCAAEYVVRAAAGELAPDPTADAYGGTITRLREKVGPIDTETEYLPGSTTGSKLPAYPAADRWMRPYAKAAGRTIRG